MNYEQKYLDYKQKYKNLKQLNGGLGLFRSDPTAYTEFKDEELNISNKNVKEIKINGIDVKIDSFNLRKNVGATEYYNIYRYHNYQIIVLSLPNKANTKNYIPYYKFEYTFDNLNQYGDYTNKEFIINEYKLYEILFKKLSPDILAIYQSVVLKYLEIIKADLYPIINKEISNLSRNIQQMEETIKTKYSITNKEQLKEEKKQVILTNIEDKIKELERLKKRKVDDINGNIDWMFKSEIEKIESSLKKEKSRKEHLENLIK